MKVFIGSGFLYGVLASALFLYFLSAVESPHGFTTMSIAVVAAALAVGGAFLGWLIGELVLRYNWLGHRHSVSTIGTSSMTGVRILRGVLAAVGVFLLFAGAFGVIFIRSHWGEIQQPQAVLGAGLCAVLAASLAFIAASASAVETAANRVQTHAREVERALHDRYTEAAAQLGDAEATFAKRMGGAYALASVADDWLAYDSTRTFEAEVAVDLMCAYLRANTHQKDWGKDELGKRGEESVRDSLIVLLREHNYLPEFRKTERKSGRPWPSPHVSINLDTADLTSVDWTDLRLHSIQLRAADLTGAWLSRSQFVNADLSEAVLVDADLTGSVLTGATVTNCDLRGANLAAATLDTQTPLAEIYSGISPVSGKPTVWPKGFDAPPARSPATDADPESAEPSQVKSGQRRRHPAVRLPSNAKP